MTLRPGLRRALLSFLIVFGGLGSGATLLFTTRVDMTRAAKALEGLSTAAGEAAFALRQRCASAAECAEIDRVRADLRQRLRDFRSAATVVAGLSETCRECGARVMEIQPVAEGGGSAASPDFVPRRYRLAVKGDVAALARLLDACPRQRLPAQVVQFTIRPDADEQPSAESRRRPPLSAEIVVECFQSRLGRTDSGA